MYNFVVINEPSDGLALHQYNTVMCKGIYRHSDDFQGPDSI